MYGQFASPVGAADGLYEGSCVGIREGMQDGVLVGAVGFPEGTAVGRIVGIDEGFNDEGMQVGF